MINLRRGLLRLWVVLSIVWITAVSVHAYTVGLPRMTPSYAAQQRPDATAAPPRDPTLPPLPPGYYDTPEEAACVAKAQRDAQAAQVALATVEIFGRLVLIDEPHVAWALGPPLVVLVIGAGLAWAFAGFRPTTLP